MRSSSTQRKWSGMQVERPKQARRRLHTCVPRQVKVWNMAEARREIAMALKLHRESMRQATERCAKQEKNPSLGHSQHLNSLPNPKSSPTCFLHPAVGEDEMAEIRQISQRLETEWNDMVNSMRSAWWSNVLKNVNGDYGVSKEAEQLFQSLDEVFHLQAWFGSFG